MLRKITTYFIPVDQQGSPEAFRKYQLVVSIILITVLFDLNYAGTCLMIGMQEGINIMVPTAFFNVLLLFAVRRGLALPAATNLYVSLGVFAILVCIYYSGGFDSPVLPWLATSPIVAMLMAGRGTGMFWMGFNTLCVIVFSLLSKNQYSFPIHYDHSYANFLATNCYAGLVLIIFFAALVFENGKNTALAKLAENNLLLAEEKKKRALSHVSQEIHDSVGQTLSVVKLNLHLLSGKTPGENAGIVQDTLVLAGKAISELRNISHNLYADNILHFNLIDAVQAELHTLDRVGSFKTNLAVDGNHRPLDPSTEFVLFRIVKEGINNIIKHAQASAIDISISYHPGRFSLSLQDDGIGFSETGSLPGQGLINIQDRITLLGGQMQIKSGKNKGTALVVNLPLN